MKDYLFLSFFLGHDAGEEARALLREHDLLDEAESAHANRRARDEFHSGVSLRLPADDGRLQRLVAHLRKRGLDPFTRIDREYSRQELDGAEWLMLRIATAGLLGGVDYSQKYDMASACTTCGAGAAPVSPLIADLSSMGKKDIDHLIYEGHLIVSTRVADAFAGMSGLKADAVRSPRGAANPKFTWLHITSILPRWHPSTRGYQTENPCPQCLRAGHFGNSKEAEAVWYEPLDHAADFNLTWEYFGNWRQQRNTSQTHPIGGGQGIVVSQRVRQALVRLKVKRLVWTPISIATILRQR